MDHLKNIKPYLPVLYAMTFGLFVGITSSMRQDGGRYTPWLMCAFFVIGLATGWFTTISNLNKIGDVDADTKWRREYIESLKKYRWQIRIIPYLYFRPRSRSMIGFILTITALCLLAALLFRMGKYLRSFSYMAILSLGHYVGTSLADYVHGRIRGKATTLAQM